MRDFAAAVGAALSPTSCRLAAIVGVGALRLLAERHHHHRPAPITARRRLVAAGLASAGPIAVGGYAAFGQPTRWQLPQTGAGRILLATHVGAGALLEELIWRSPLLWAGRRRARVAWSVLIGAGFVAGHLRKDGARAIPLHAVNTASWTLATLYSRQIRWSALSHTAYNLVALTLQPTQPTQPTQPAPGPAQPSGART